MAQAFEMMMSEKAKALAKKPPRLLSKKQLEFLKNEYLEIEKALRDRQKELEAANPLYYYSPVTGNISDLS